MLPAERVKNLTYDISTQKNIYYGWTSPQSMYLSRNKNNEYDEFPSRERGVFIVWAC